MKCPLQSLLCVIVLLLRLWNFANGEVFTALVDLEPLLHTKGEIVRSLGKYLELEEQRLEKVRWLRKEYDKLYQAAIGDVDTFLSNPVNAYLLVKRLTADWKTAGRLIEGARSKAIIDNITLQDLKFPDEEDLQGAASALMRLQDTYLLDTTQLAKGEITGTSHSSELTAGDCFELGHQAHNQQDYHHTLLWMQEALERLEQEEVKTMSKSAILEHMAYATYMLGNVRHALKLTQDLIAIAPEHPRALNNLRYYDEKWRVNQQNGIQDTFQIDMNPKDVFRPRGEIFHNYERLCRGEETKSAKSVSPLFCHYTTNNNSYLFLQPVKKEILNLEPKIVMFHDVIRDKDINTMKRLSQPKLERATVVNFSSGKGEYASYRVSKSAWLYEDEHPRISHISHLIKEITGLETDTAEPLHLINYGIGGHYEPHCDFRRDGEATSIDNFGTGNRIATFIFYLSDVDAGGATVFPDIGVQVKPVKGSAAFWYNLKRNGKGDYNTKHAACPVLAGTKWVANKWLHEREQEFRRPCTLNPLE